MPLLRWDVFEMLIVFSPPLITSPLHPEYLRLTGDVEIMKALGPRPSTSRALGGQAVFLG